MARHELTTAEVVKFSGATPRMLQWWDERGYLRPLKKESHRRFYSQEQAVCARNWVKTRKQYALHFNSPAERALRKHGGKIVILRRGQFAIVDDTLFIGAGA